VVSKPDLGPIPTGAANVRIGSNLEVAALPRNVCFAPVSGHRQAVSAGPKSADIVAKVFLG
jgi:hypothetical protein